MIVQAIVILLIILIIVNIMLGFYNRIYPPCLDADDYFRNARIMPDGVSSDLGSITSGTNNNYIGTARFATGVPNTVGLKSWASTHSNQHEQLVNPVIADAEEHDLKLHNKSDKISTEKISKDAYDVISAAFPVSSQQSSTDNKKSTSTVNKNMGDFEVDFEGIRASNYTGKKTGGKRPSGFKYTAELDGYQDDTGNQDP